LRRSVTPDQAGAAAREHLAALSETASCKSPAALTPRQREVAVLIARGYTNQQIAAALVLTAGTVANHIEHILGRLNCHNRAQIAAWAVQVGLVAASGPAQAEA
jgi:DNA-binding NarL/FixJ family response regulator